MFFGKGLTGLWLTYLHIPFKLSDKLLHFRSKCAEYIHIYWKKSTWVERIGNMITKPTKRKLAPQEVLNSKENEETTDKIPDATAIQESSNDMNNLKGDASAKVEENPDQSIDTSKNQTSNAADKACPDTDMPEQKVSTKTAKTHTPKSARSLYPPAIMGFAMVARGEIAFLIASIAKSKGIYTDELYLIVIWAAVVCTVIGPLGAGLIVKRVKKLEVERSATRPDQGVLGVWGMT